MQVSSDDTLSVSPVISLPQISSNSSRSRASEEFDFKFTDLKDAYCSGKLNQDIRISISKTEKYSRNMELEKVKAV